jgi:AraC-like DNA-binding protein
MEIEHHLPHELLRPFIKTYMVIETGEELVNRVLPGTSLAIAFRYKGQVNYLNSNAAEVLPLSAISGLRRSVRLINYQPGAGNILVLFKEAGAAMFFKDALHELFEESISLDHFIGQQQLSLIEEQLAEAAGNSQRFAIIEKFLLSRLNLRQADQLVAAAIERIYAVKGVVRIKDLAAALYISNDAFEKRFRRAVGASPKQFSSIVRMKTLIGKVRPEETLTQMALNAGYFDQAHFNKEFKLFTGQTPSGFFQSGAFW